METTVNKWHDHNTITAMLECSQFMIDNPTYVCIHVCVYVYIYIYIYIYIQGTHKINPVCSSRAPFWVDYVRIMCADYVRTFCSDYVRDFCVCVCVCTCVYVSSLVRSGLVWSSL